MVDRTRILKALTLETMPDEAFDWLVLATRQSAMVRGMGNIRGANVQIWPDGIGGFTQASKDAITEVRSAAEEYIRSREHAG